MSRFSTPSARADARPSRAALRWAMAAGMAAALTGIARAEPPPDSGIVRVLVTYQDVNQFLPWIRERPRERQGYGVRVDASLILTTESVLRNHRLVELQRPRAGEKAPAEVVVTDTQANLALLRVTADRAQDAPAPLPLAQQVPREGVFEILQFFDSGEIQKIQASMVRITMARLPEAPFSSLVFSLQTDSNINGQGAPVLLKGQLAGIVIAYDRTSRIATVLPCPVIRHFIDDVKAPPYQGFASAGFMRLELVDPVKRSYLGVKRDGVGVLVQQCLPGSPSGKVLRPGDVILDWDGHPIDNMGFYEDADFGRIDFTYLMKGRRQPGDIVPVTIVREKKEIQIQLQLECRSDAAALIPEDVEGVPPEYLVEGGIVLREITGKYLQAHGADWVRNVDPRLAHLYLSRQYAPEKPGERVVVIAVVLADPVNVGYQQLRNQIVTAVNGEPIANIHDIFKIARRDGNLRRISLRSVGVDVVLDPDLLREANARLARVYRIPNLRYERPSQNEMTPPAK